MGGIRRGDNDRYARNSTAPITIETAIMPQMIRARCPTFASSHSSPRQGLQTPVVLVGDWDLLFYGAARSFAAMRLRNVPFFFLRAFLRTRWNSSGCTTSIRSSRDIGRRVPLATLPLMATTMF
jgi:hypothetical protein